MAKATFSRKPTVSTVRLTGTLTTRVGDGVVLDDDAAALLNKVVEAIDALGIFEVETLTATVK